MTRNGCRRWFYLIYIKYVIVKSEKQKTKNKNKKASPKYNNFCCNRESYSCWFFDYSNQNNVITYSSNVKSIL